MIYMIPRAYDGLEKEKFGIITTPHYDSPSRMIVSGYAWCADNEAFSGKFSEHGKKNTIRANRLGFYDWLEMMLPYQVTCKFVSIPDVVGDAKSTIDLYPQYAPRVRELGYMVAFVGQDGLENYGLPDDFDAFFIGGSTAWKLSKAARELAQEAKQRGLWVHMGRVNSLARIHYAESIGCDSVDGTHIIFEPRRASQRLVAWMNQKSLFYGGY